MTLAAVITAAVGTAAVGTEEVVEGGEGMVGAAVAGARCHSGCMVSTRLNSVLFAWFLWGSVIFMAGLRLA